MHYLSRSDQSTRIIATAIAACRSGASFMRHSSWLHQSALSAIAQHLGSAHSVGARTKHNTSLISFARPLQAEQRLSEMAINQYTYDWRVPHAPDRSQVVH